MAIAVAALATFTAEPGFNRASVPDSPLLVEKD